ncbi:hypothetical protein FGE12_13180 [Aggregicoccus sp. 17bor-14]|uniref:hypothetical protein n=1 Tax=Myxococcaceae TaxID=31 RepID=UPI00129C8670|nr:MULTISPECIES: hypothetical protein [Myxococcaceae]MBF5043344.1 hypothetical protein [Simulacricoccus sp. 17bor-14]MRI89103.1 hypothetical protein [Aggregicoccus sp. 17bor-14]
MPPSGAPRPASLRLLALLMLLPAAALAAADASGAPAAPAAPASPGLLEPQPVPSDNYGESFTFLADLQDGTYVWTQLSFTHLGPGSHHGVCRALVVRGGAASAQPAWTPSERVSKGQWGYDAAARALRVGPCSATEGEHPAVRMAFGDGTLELTFAQGFHPFTPPGATLSQGAARYRAEVLLPWSPVQVRLARKGLPEERLAGSGYVDHSHSTFPPAKLAQAWVRFRAPGTAPHPLLVGREAQDGGYGPVYFWSDGSGAQALTRFALRREGTRAATRWTAEFGDAAATPWRLRSTGFVYRSAPVEDLGLMGALVRPLVGSPVTYTHRAVLERAGAPPVSGLLEVTLEE